MKIARLVLVATGMLSAMLLAAPSYAQNRTDGGTGSGETPRAMTQGAPRAAKAKPAPKLTIDPSTATRALELDDTAAAKAFTIIGRTSDGKDVTIAPDQKVLDAIRNAKAGGKKTEIEGGGGDTAADGGASRDVVGQDNRVQVTNATNFPFSTVGYLETTNKKGEVWSCTAAMIGPKLALTAASCLYDHAQEGGWYDKVTFWPAINGENSVPYGGFDADTVYVFQAFITDFDGTYDTIWQYDVGLVQFKDPIGDSLGWLGYDGGDLGDFQANLVAYNDDKPAFTMWRANCNIIAENIGAADFGHDCDAAGGSMGAPMYYYDQSNKGRYIAGVHIGAAGETNWAIRLYGPIYEWIASLNK